MVVNINAKKVWNSNWVQYGGTVIVAILVLFGSNMVARHTAPKNVNLDYVVAEVVDTDGKEYNLITRTTCPVIFGSVDTRLYGKWSTRGVRLLNERKLNQAMIKDFIHLEDGECYIGDINQYEKRLTIEFTGKYSARLF